MKKILLGILALNIWCTGRSQDFHLSLYDAAPMYLNPAMTGVFDGEWRIHAHYRTQWKSVNFKPYQTALISLDRAYNKWGFGGQIINYRAGYGDYNALQGLFSAGYTLPVDQNKYHNISFGVQGGLTQKAVKTQLHSYNNQYTTTGGGSFNTSLPNGENFANNSFLIPDVNAGLFYYYTKQQSRLNPFIGVSAFNLLTPKESFFSANNELPMRFYVHAGSRVNITEKLYLIPKVLVMAHEEFREMTFAVDAGYYLVGSDLYLMAGLIYRNKDAGILWLGAKKDNYIARFGYDINTSSLSPATNGRGGFEVSFTYIFRKYEPETKKICPRL